MTQTRQHDLIAPAREAAHRLLSAALQRLDQQAHAAIIRVNDDAWGCARDLREDALMIRAACTVPKSDPNRAAIEEVLAELREKYGDDADPAGLANYVATLNCAWHRFRRETVIHEMAPDHFAAARCTDTANAARFVEHFGHLVRHSNTLGWLVWDGARWLRGEKAAREHAKCIEGLIRAEVRLLEEAMDLTDRETLDRFTHYVKALRRHAKHSAAQKQIQALMHLAESDPRINADAEAFDEQSWLLNCANGTINLRDGRLSDPKPDDRITQQCPTAYDSEATCPRWRQFLEEVFEGDRELIDYLQWAAGYSLTGETRHHVFFILHGFGRNGKSTFLNTLLHVLGRDYAQQLNAEELMVQRNARHSTELAALRGSRLVATIESTEGRQLNEALVKSITGGDRIRARFMRQDAFEFQPALKLWMATNYRPNIRDASVGMWERIRLIPFERQFSAEEKDPGLPEALRAEAEGILVWAVEGARQAHTEPPVPARVKAAVEEYQSDSDIVGEFLEECCSHWDYARVPKGELFKAYHRWTEGRCEGRKTFNQRMAQRGYSELKAGGIFYWRGLNLRAGQ